MPNLLLSFLLSMLIFAWLYHNPAAIPRSMGVSYSSPDYQRLIDSVNFVSGALGIVTAILSIITAISIVNKIRKNHPGKELDYIAQEIKGSLSTMVFNVVNPDVLRDSVPAVDSVRSDQVINLKPATGEKSTIDSSKTSGSERIFRFFAVFLGVSSFSYITYEYFGFAFYGLFYKMKGFVFFIAMISIFLKALEVRNESIDTKIFARSAVFLLPDFDRISDLRFIGTRVSRRTMLIRNNIGDLQALHDLLPSAGALDAELLNARYVSVFVYAWMLPVIGFIGTARGMAEAVDGFQFGATGEMGIKLGETIQGLSNSFQSTVSALTATVVVYVCVTALKSWDKSNLDLLDNSCLEIVSVIPSVSMKNDISYLLTILESLISKLHDATDLPLNVNAINSAAKETVKTLEKAASIMGDSAKSVEQSGNLANNYLKRSLTELSLISEVVDKFNALPNKIEEVSRTAEEMILILKRESYRFNEHSDAAGPSYRKLKKRVEDLIRNTIHDGHYSDGIFRRLSVLLRRLRKQS